jgi:probable F420-dependent oxidoreductase
MRLGLHALGIGYGARRDVIDAVAAGAEGAGFATLWAGEHVVMVDHGSSRYPYAADGRIAMPSRVDWLDPLIALSFAAAATKTIRLATGVVLVPEHNPVMLAKQVASLDTLAGGRVALGVGIGWSREEFDALGVPFERRGARTDEYLDAMRTIWREEVASFDGQFVSFADIRVNPKPRGRRVPVIVGGNSEAALRRVATRGDGWYGFNLDGAAHVRDRVACLRRLCAERGRDPDELEITVALVDPEAVDPRELEEVGVDELVLVASPPSEPGRAGEWLGALRSVSAV